LAAHNEIAVTAAVKHSNVGTEQQQQQQRKPDRGSAEDNGDDSGKQ
jgi:hypothetical protein